jgi:hypothetical protein
MTGCAPGLDLTAHAGGGQPEDGMSGLLDPRIGRASKRRSYGA